MAGTPKPQPVRAVDKHQPGSGAGWQELWLPNDKWSARSWLFAKFLGRHWVWCVGLLAVAWVIGSGRGRWLQFAVLGAAGVVILVGGAALIVPEVQAALRSLHRWVKRRKLRRYIETMWPEAMAAAGMVTGRGGRTPVPRIGYVGDDMAIVHVRVGEVGKSALELVTSPGPERVAATMEARRCRVVPRSPTDATVTLSWGVDPLAEPVPVSQLPPSDRKHHAVYGITEDADPATLTYRSSILFAGLPGAGKSTALWSWLYGLTRLDIEGRWLRLWVIDPKGGMELKALEPLAGDRYTKDEGKGSVDLLDRLVETMKRKETVLRNADQREHIATPETPHDLLIIDETLDLPLATRKASSDGKGGGQLVKLPRRGRAAGVTIVAATQATDLASLGDVRRFLPQRVAFATESRTMTEGVLGEGAEGLGAAASRIHRQYQRGVAYYQDEDQGRDFVRVRAGLTEDLDIPRTVAALRRIVVLDQPERPVSAPVLTVVKDT